MKKLNLNWVSDVIGEDYKNWRKGDVVTIQAQTGTGKTHFITNKLIPNMKDNEKMLLVSNRINLKRQVKKDLFIHYNIPLPTTLEELDEVREIENTTIMSYQTIAELKSKQEYGQAELNLDVYDYIICDECHFFLTDSAFNNRCDLAFRELIKGIHRNAIKIFISATIDEVERTIIKSVDDTKVVGFESYSDSQLHTYKTKTDYSYLDVKYFKKIKDIVQLIKNDKTDDKWLIFVTRKDKGNEIKDELEGICTCEFITKETKADECEDLKSIINSSKFNSKVLIATKALDNGVNIKDEQVKNIVIMSYDKTTFIQELGRLRFDINNAPMINLYIPCYGFATFNTMLNTKFANIKKKIKEHDTDEVDFNRKYKRDYNELPKEIFYMDKESGNFNINLLGFARFHKDIRFMEDIVERFSSDKKFAYIKEQLSWLELEDSFDENNLIEDMVDLEIAKDLEVFLNDSYENEVLYNKKFFVETISAIIEADNNLRILFNKLDGGKSRAKGQELLNKLFKELYKANIFPDIFIVSTKKRKETIDKKRVMKSYWIITKIEN